MKIKVCHLTSVHPAFDTRIFLKECKSLAEAGYDVSLIAVHDKKEMIDGVKIIPFFPNKNRLMRILFSPPKMFTKALKQKAGIYHFHDPELIVIGIFLKIFGKKVVYDVHEDYRKQILYKDWIKFRFLKKLVAETFSLFEKISVKFFNKIAVANPCHAVKFPPLKTVILRNLPVLHLIDSVEPYRIQKDRKIIIYVGGLAEVRGIKEIIQAVKFVEEDVELWLLGKWYCDKYRKKCESLEEWKYVKYFGFKNPVEVYSYLKVADIGLSMLYPIKNYLTSLPVKAFEYMACSLPVVMSDIPYWKRMFSECAHFANSHDPRDIAAKINLILRCKEIRDKSSEIGRKLTEKIYKWEAENVQLQKLYNDIV